MSAQVWYRRKDGTIGTYTGSWNGPVKHGPDGPYQRFNCGGGNFRTFSLQWIVKVCENGRQVWPIPRKMTRDQSGKFVKG